MYIHLYKYIYILTISRKYGHGDKKVLITAYSTSFYCYSPTNSTASFTDV